MKILIIGSGGREHALAERLAKSTLVTRIYISPGNGGSGLHPKCTNLGCLTYDELVEFAADKDIDLVVPGPEQALVDGIEGRLRKVGIPCFGPTASASRMEGSKAFSKDFMSKYNIPTARYANFTNFESAKKHLLSTDYKVVIKASGLAAGKGVLIPETQQEALNALETIMVKKEFGASGDEVVIEEHLEGQEISVLALSDGYTVVLLPGAQDHKRIGEGDTGLNTGGMGAYAPTPIASSDHMKASLKSIIQRTIDGMRKEGMSFVGCLFTGFMLTEQGPKVLEYNVRFGDPETQTVMGLLSDDTDLAEVFMACCDRRLDSVKVDFKRLHSVTVVIASPGYPNSYPKGLQVTIDHDSLPKNSFVYHAGTSPDSSDPYVTTGGRVFAVNGMGETLEIAARTAYEAVACVEFEGMTYRKDIAHRALKPQATTSSSQSERNQNGLTYLDSGVSIDSGNELVARIKHLVKATARLGCDSVIGGFGGLFDLKSVGYCDPVIVSGTDGVGTKLIVAQKAGKHDTVGIDLVAMSVNDLLVQGAEPLFFLDYFACNHLNVDVAVDVVKGITEGCKQSNCALVGGETAEMPGLYRDDDYDLAGFAVGVVERSLILPRLEEIGVEDVLIGLTSSGFHSNGFSLVRKVIERSGLSYESACPWQPEQTLGVALLEPTRIYTQQLLPILKSEERLIKGLSHITGGGFLENVPRVLPAGLGCEIDAASFPLPAPFKWLMKQSHIHPLEMCRTFNCGIGMVLIVSNHHVSRLISLLESLDPEHAVGIYQIGKITSQPGVEMKRLESWL
ncbi:phosphoribosylamine-glycine ligase [Puccinia sorghi]|uniref:Phosphoribosylamine-glycine ligase n=1 Tax=Puccinia sorghi TaxID=27349 RepID=A0A0L6U6Y8_9BASI|nr:phosphoribosylamine-glycine ligase [Puccinia sorghi]